ncbi:MmgE/PrpD family protein [Rhodococcus sp. NPDC059968]|uniref:MmgE/PrpD family protein n=1 Tax=Rhodococcus sp. NPDC059968 TaxID=3347017 RepID=UPI003670F513
MSTTTFDVVKWICGASPRAEAADTFTSAHLSLVDFVGCSIAGSDHSAARAVTAISAISGEVPALGHSTTRLHAASAAYLHALQAHAFELDDGDWDTWGHLGAPTIAAGLSAGWLSNATVGDVTDAVATALVFGMSLGRQVNPGHYQHGFCTTGTIGALTAAAAAARLLRLDEVSTAHALDFAVAQATGVRQFALDGSASCLIIPANAARVGYEAAALAAAGLAGGLEALDGQLGFLRVIGGAAAADLRLPAYPEHRPSQIYYKPHSCCGNALGPIRGFVEGWERLDHAPLRHILFELPREVTRNVNHATPDSELERHLSLQLAVAMHLTRGAIAARDLIDVAVTDELKQIMGIVQVEVLKTDNAHELRADEMGFVSLIAADGRKLRCPVTAVGPAMGESDIDEKFRSLVESSIGERGSERLRSMLGDWSSPVREVLLAGRVPAQISSASAFH